MKYCFMIMNFTKPGVTGGSGYRRNELVQRVLYKSKKNEQSNEWKSIGPEDLEFVKTKVARRKKDVLASGADSDQDDWIEEAFGNDPDGGASPNALNRVSSMGPKSYQRQNTTKQQDKQVPDNTFKKKRTFYYYALKFEFEFDHDDDTVLFAFSRPYPYSEIIVDMLDKENQIRPEGVEVPTIPKINKLSRPPA